MTPWNYSSTRQRSFRTMLIARTQSAFDYFKRQFTDRLIKRIYGARAWRVRKSHDIITRVTRSKRTGAMASLPVSSSEGKEGMTEYDVRQNITHRDTRVGVSVDWTNPPNSRTFFCNQPSTRGRSFVQKFNQFRCAR